MKRFFSIILSVLMLMSLFCTGAAAAQYEWVTKTEEDFSSFTDGVIEGKTSGAGQWYVGYGKATTVTNSVEAYGDTENPAIAIKRTGSGDRRLYYKLSNITNAQTEISFKLLCSVSGAANMDVAIFGANESGELDSNTLITGFYSNGAKIYTRYNGTDAAFNNTATWPADTYVTVTYMITPETGYMKETIVGGGINITREKNTDISAISNVAGFCVRSKGSDPISIYIDDVVVKQYEKQPIDIESEFTFDKISDENINAVTKDLNLVPRFTDSDQREWSVDYVSSNNDIINDETGSVSRPAIDTRVTLSAILTDSGDGGETETSATKVFSVRVLADGTYYLAESFDKEGDYSGRNAIASYIGSDGEEWGVGSNYGLSDTANVAAMDAHITADPKNSDDKVLMFSRTAVTGKPEIQRVWTKINSDQSQLTGKVYASMRIFREVSNTPTQLYFYDAANTRLFYLEFRTDNKMQYFFNTDIKSSGTTDAVIPSGEWFDLTAELDMKNQKYSIYVNGTQLVTPRVFAQSSAGFGGLMLDLTRSAYNAQSSVYIDDITIRTTDDSVYAVSDYIFVDENGYRTHSAEEGGALQSLKIKKLNSSESAATAYVCFYKDNSLKYTYPLVIGADNPVGSFNLDANITLPADVLSYNIKTFIFDGSLKPLTAAASEYVPESINPTIFVAGDSIAKTYSASEYPQTGYAQVFSEFFTGNINIENHAEGGRSSKSFIDEGRLNRIWDKMRSGDYLFIQFGHNDEKTTDGRYTDPSGDKNTEGSFKNYLMKYITGARERGAVPVLITPPGRCTFDGNGKLYDERLLKYVVPMRELAAEENVLLVDLYDGWKSFVDSRESSVAAENYYMFIYQDDKRFANDQSYAGSKYKTASSESYINQLFAHYYDEYPTRIVHGDGTHFNAYSARIGAQLIAKSLKENGGDLSEYVQNTDASIAWPWSVYETFGTTLHTR